MTPSLICNAHLGEGSSQRAGLLGAKVEGQVLLALQVLAEVGALLLVDDSKDAGDALAGGVDAGELGARAAGDLLHPQLEQLLLELLELLGEVRLGLRLKLVCLDLRLKGTIIGSVCMPWEKAGFVPGVHGVSSFLPAS